MGIEVSDPAVEALGSESRGLGPSPRAQVRRVASQAGGRRWRAESQGLDGDGDSSLTLLRSCPRSAEALTPLHVAAGRAAAGAWSCCWARERTLLSPRPGRGPIAVSSQANPEGGKRKGKEEEREGRGAPTDRTPAGQFLPLDLAEQQGHQNCACVLRELETRTGIPAPAGLERLLEARTQTEPGGEWCLGGWEWLASDITLQISVSNAQGFTTSLSGQSLCL